MYAELFNLLKSKGSKPDIQKAIIRYIDLKTAYSWATQEPTDAFTRYDKLPLIQNFLQTIRYLVQDDQGKIRPQKVKNKTGVAGDTTNKDGTSLTALLVQGLMQVNGFIPNKELLKRGDYTGLQIGKNTIYYNLYESKYQGTDIETRDAIRSQIIDDVWSVNYKAMNNPDLSVSSIDPEYLRPRPLSPDEIEKLEKHAEKFYALQQESSGNQVDKEFADLIYQHAGILDLCDNVYDGIPYVKQVENNWLIEISVEINKRNIRFGISITEGFVRAITDDDEEITNDQINAELLTPIKETSNVTPTSFGGVET